MFSSSEMSLKIQNLLLLKLFMIDIVFFLGFIPHGHKTAPVAPGITSYTKTRRAVSPSMSIFYQGGKPVPGTLLFAMISHFWGSYLHLSCKEN